MKVERFGLTDRTRANTPLCYAHSITSPLAVGPSSRIPVGAITAKLLPIIQVGLLRDIRDTILALLYNVNSTLAVTMPDQL